MNTADVARPSPVHAYAGLVLAVALVACSKRSESPAATGSGSASAPSPGTLHLVAELRGMPMLVEGTRRIALRFHDEAFWYETAPGKLELRAEVGDRVARQIAELGGGPPTILLGATVIVSGGEHHHEKHVRIGEPPREVGVDGFVDQVAAFDTGDEIWRVEHEAQQQLVIVHADGRVAPVAPFERLGKEVETMSPVSAKICAHPATVDIAGNGTHVVALVRECDPDAPYRIARFQLPGPSLTITKLGSQQALGFDARAIAIGKDGTVALAGIRGDAHAIARIVRSAGGRLAEGAVEDVSIDRSAGGRLAEGAVEDVSIVRSAGGRLAEGAVEDVSIDASGRVTVAVGPGGVRVIGEAILADDGALWSTVALNEGTVLRDNVPVALRVRGEPLRAVELWYDRHFGVVVLAAHRDGSSWLLAERPPAGREIAIPPR